MRKIAATFLTFLMLFGATTPTYAWGDKGHKTVGQIAQLHLANTSTLNRIRQILRQNETLASVSTWADKVKTESNFKPNATHPDSDTQAFFQNMANRTNRNWHFVNLALDCESYDDCRDFQKPTDVVNMINLCIRKLRGGNVPQLTLRNALRMLVHLVGDMHQPLHVGVGFINVDGPNDTIVIETDPARILANDFINDLGGNKLLIRNEESDNLHSFWDTDLVEELIGDRTIAAFGRDLKDRIPQQQNWNGQGQLSTWAAQWATDSLQTSRENAYSTVSIRREVVIEDDVKYLIRRGNNYKSNNKPVVEQQLAKGGYRLARMLQAIFP
jgi:S1/P1 Nuclease